MFIDTLMMDIITLLIGIGVGSFLLILIGGMEVRAFLRSKIKKKPMLIIARNDKMMDFVSAEYVSRIARCKYGDFAIPPQTTYITPSGARIGIVYENFATTLPAEFITSSNELLNNGIKTYNDALLAKQEVEKLENEIKAEIDSIEKRAKENKKLSEEDKQELDRLYTMLQNIGKTSIAIDTIKNFFEYNFEPNSVRSIINRAVATIVGDYKKMDLKWLIYAGIFAILIAVALGILAANGGLQSILGAFKMPVGTTLG